MLFLPLLFYFKRCTNRISLCIAFSKSFDADSNFINDFLSTLPSVLVVNVFFTSGKSFKYSELGTLDNACVAAETNCLDSGLGIFNINCVCDIYKF